MSENPPESEEFEVLDRSEGRRDACVATFNAYRALLLSIAYRILGGMADAEDIVQDAFIRWQAVQGPIGNRRRRKNKGDRKTCAIAWLMIGNFLSGQSRGMI